MESPPARFGRSGHKLGRRVHRAGFVLPRVAGGYRVRWKCGLYCANPIWLDEMPDDGVPCFACGAAAADIPAGVYFARRADGLIKIGCSEQPAVRMVALKAELIAVQPGDFETERTLHRVFADDLAEGREWFRPSLRLRTYLYRLLTEQARAENAPLEASA